MTVPIPTELCDLIESGPPAYLSTINADGSPQVSMIWIGVDEEGMFSVHMRENLKLRNIQRDPRVVLSFGPVSAPREWMSPHVVIRATASAERSADAFALMARLAATYVGLDADLPGGSEPGHIVRYEIERIGGKGPWAT